MVVSVPSLNWLRVFEAAARTQSFARAAAELNMSAAAVSQQIKALEAHLSAVLFERQAQSVRLTERGWAYLPSVGQALALLEVSTEGLFGAAQDQPLFVRSVLLFAHGVLAPAMPLFQAAHPRVRLMLSSGNIASDFAQNYSEMQIIFGPPAHYGAEYDVLLGEELTPVARPDVAARITSVADLAGEVLIEVGTHRAGWQHVFDSLGAGQPTRLLYTDSSLMASALAQAGIGIMLARRPASDLAVSNAGLVPCLDGIAVDGRDSYHLVYADRMALRPAARAFRGWLLDHLQAIAKPRG